MLVTSTPSHQLCHAAADNYYSNFSTHRGLPLLKADAKAAFLQGLATQGQRSIFGRPVEELRQAMGLDQHQLIQFLKAAYGLTIAPREFLHDGQRHPGATSTTTAEDRPVSLAVCGRGGWQAKNIGHHWIPC